MGLSSYTHPDFWKFYLRLPKDIQTILHLVLQRKGMSGQSILGFITEQSDTKKTIISFGFGSALMKTTTDL
jgi:hypothetical protein